MSKKTEVISRTEFIPVELQDPDYRTTAVRHKQPNAGNFVGVSEVTENKILWRQLIAELIGTFLLTSIGVASCISINPVTSTSAIALCFGLLVASIVQAIAHVSGGHINPAVTVGLLVSGDIKLLRAICYILVQLIGAVAGAALIRVSIPEDKIGGFGMTLPGVGVSEEQAMLVEILITFVLIFVVKGVIDSHRGDVKGSGPLAIGLAVTACHCAAIQFSGSSMNPARSFGPAAVQGDWHAHWVYWAGPMIGGVLAGLLYKFVITIKPDVIAGSYDL